MLSFRAAPTKSAVPPKLSQDRPSKSKDPAGIGLAEKSCCEAAAVSDGAYHITVDVVTLGLLAVPGVVVAVLLARRRDYPPGHCQRCGFDLTGNVSGRCSDCGRKVRLPRCPTASIRVD
jgi:hypothetical protein